MDASFCVVKQGKYSKTWIAYLKPKSWLRAFNSARENLAVVFLLIKWPLHPNVILFLEISVSGYAIATT